MLTAHDCDLRTPSGPDKFRIQIWDEQERLVYDNGPNTDLRGGNISIKSK
jgi:hypothetical protein